MEGGKRSLAGEIDWAIRTGGTTQFTVSEIKIDEFSFFVGMRRDITEDHTTELEPVQVYKGKYEILLSIKVEFYLDIQTILVQLIWDIEGKQYEEAVLASAPWVIFTEAVEYDTDNEKELPATVDADS